MYNMNYSGGGFRGFGVLATGAKKKSANTKILQKALNAAGYDAGTVDGSFGTKTRAAMQTLQTSKGLIPTDWPDNYVLAGLDIAYDKWVGIVQDSGAPADIVNAIAQRVAGHGGLPSADAGAPKSVTLPSGDQIIVEGTTPIPGTTQEIATLPSGEQFLIEKTAVEPAAAAVGLSTKAWFTKNWPYLAAGGGIGVLAIVAAVLWTRKREEAPAMLTPENVEHMAGYGRRSLRGLGHRFLTKAEAVREFKAEVLPHVIAQYSKNDRPAIREAWNDWTDMLQKDGRISAKQYDTWVGPFRGFGDWEQSWTHHKRQMIKHKNRMHEHEVGMYGGKLGAGGPRPAAMHGAGFGMTKKEAEAEFRAEVMPYVVEQYGRDDRVALAEEWNNWTDALRTGRRITAKQYATWSNPF
jgi:peptidoglycan hydrolase-like protein with peptidoglycan-binding domain